MEKLTTTKINVILTFPSIIYRELSIIVYQSKSSYVLSLIQVLKKATRQFKLPGNNCGIGSIYA